MAKILVVDDEPDMIWALTNVLLSENHSVISVNSGEEALEKLKVTSVELVLLDFRLPGMDGIQILEKIKGMKPDLPVIMVTGYGGIEEAVQSIKLGAAHYIPKPFDNDQLIEVVNKSLNIDTLKKEGLFGKRIAEKIEPRVPVYEKMPSSPKRPLKLSKSQNIAAAVVLFFLIGAGSAYYWFTQRESSHEYQVTNARVSGLSWGGGYLWTCDWFAQTVQQYQIQNENLELLRTYPLQGYHLTGITWAEGMLYSCDSWKRLIYKHRLDNDLSIVEKYNSPGPNPSGLFFDGKYLWSCDGNTQKVYQHNLDDKLTVLATYDSPAIFPVGMHHDKKDFWCASAVGMKIFKISMQERFRLEKTYILPDSVDIAQQISAFTVQGKKIWIAYEGVNKIFERNISKLVEVKP